MPHKKSFIDQARIFVQAGNGGDGHVGFLRAKFIPRGGPDGGDGGRGGDVALIGSEGLSSLLDFQYKRIFRAGNGQPGGRSQRSGATGASVNLSVPLGTLVKDDKSGELLGEVLRDKEALVLAEGGRGGLGNVHFKTSTNRAPRKATFGRKREGIWLRLELRLLADVGIVGPPNAGKSTLLGALTSAKPKIAPYPFTTLAPSLGVARAGDRTFTLADLPGLIEGAHQGKGLGIQFLRHIARTRELLYLVAVDAGEPKDAWKEYQNTHREILEYDRSIVDRPFLVALNKIDLKSDSDVDQYVEFFKKKGIRLHPISAEKRRNLEDLKASLLAHVA
ncbi:MAG: GTPase ObgE [Pseudomonadota bacterium]